jgi:PAS domain S-box-containing protein
MPPKNSPIRSHVPLEIYQLLTRLEPFVPPALTFYGLAILIYYGHQPWQWLSLGLVAGLPVLDYITNTSVSYLRLFRAGAILLIGWLLLQSTGGFHSFFILWYALLIGVYPLLLKPPYGLWLPGLTALAYLLLAPFADVSIPGLMILTRAAFLGFVGWLIYSLGATLAIYQQAVQTIEYSRETERALRESEERWQSLVENHPESISISVAGRIIYINPAGARTLGAASPEALLGRSMAEFNATDNITEIFEARLAAINRGESTLPLRLKIIGLDGQTRYIEVSSVPIIYQGQHAAQTVTRDITAQRQAQLDLLREKNFVDMVIDSLPGIFYLFNEQGQFLRWNIQLETASGYSASDISKMRPQDFFAGPDWQAVQQAIQKVLTQGEGTLAADAVTKDGRNVPYFFTGRRITIDGKPCVVGMGLDITPRKQVEEDLRFQKTLLEFQNEATLDAILVVSPERKWLFHNQRFLDMWQFPEDIIQEASSRRGLAWAKAQFADPDQAVAQIEKLYDYPDWTYRDEVRFVDGRIFDRYSAPVRSADGVHYGRVWYYRDITEQKRTEASLRERERFIQSIADASPNILYVYDQVQEREIYLNQAVEQILGYSAAEIMALGSNFLPTLMHPDDLARLSGYRSQEWQAAPGQILERDYRMRHKNGQWRWLHSRELVFKRSPSGAVIEILGTAEDVTEARQAQKILQQEKERAEAASQAKSEFLTRMSHELRTPLNAILGYAQILNNDKTLTPVQREESAIIQRSGEHLLALINDILDLSRVEAGRLDLNPTEFHLPTFLNNIVKLFQLRAGQKGLAFHYEPAPTLPAGVQADARHLRQILINLLSNAIKFTDRGIVTFRVSWVADPSSFVTSHRSETNDARTAPQDQEPMNMAAIRFEIADTGPGILPADLELIFEPFRQAGNQNHYTEGTGLGLAISQRLAGLMGSAIQVKSQPGQGSCFWFDLELLKSSTGVSMPPILEQSITGFKGGPYKILVVDDNIDNRLLLKDALEPLGFEVIGAIDGQDGLAKMAQSQPQVVLVDLRMPVLDGLEMVRRIRQTDETKIIIAVSASAFEHSREHSLAAGCNEFISKPVQITHLLILLEKYLALEWCYGETGPENEPTTLPALIISPPAPEIIALHELILVGDVGGMLERAAAIEQMDDRCRPFVTMLRRVAADYQLMKIRQFVEEYL